jgi:hypothetical protein
MKFRKKPVTIEALQFTGDNEVIIRSWQYRHVQQVGHPSRWFFTADEFPEATPDGMDAVVYDHLHRTWVGVKAGQWVIRGVQGEFYPCAPDVFTETYEAVDA